MNGVDSVVVFIVWPSEEGDRTVNEEAHFGSGVQSSGRKDFVGEVVDEDVIGIVSFGAVDDDGLKIFVPAQRLAEKIAQFAFAFDGIVGKAIDEVVGNVVEHVGL